MARYLIIGHLTRDIVSFGFRYGGAVLYGGLTARRLGFETYIITTSAEKDLERLFPELSFFHIPANETTTFENLETKNGRRQRVLAMAPKISVKDIPPEWCKADIVHIAPVLNEISVGEVALFETGFLVANPQGWFRRVCPSGKVKRMIPDLSKGPRFKALVLSEEDIGDDEAVRKDLLCITDILVITKGAKGAWLFDTKQWISLETQPVAAIDSVGAGDILAAAFFTSLYRGKSIKEALRFAMCLARISVLRKGLSSIPTYEEINLCLKEVSLKL